MTVLSDKKSLVPLLIGGLAWLIVLAFSYDGINQHRGLKLDFANFYDAGQKAALGQLDDLYDPFAQIGGAEPLGHMSFVSAPVTSYFYAPMAGLPPDAAAMAFKAAMTLSLFLALFLLYRHVIGRFEPENRMMFFAIYSVAAMVFTPFWVMFMIGGQTTPFILLMFVIALIGVSKGQSVVPAAALVLAVLIKPVFAPGMIFILIVSSARMRTLILGIGLAGAAVSFLTAGIGPHLDLAKKILAEGSGLQIPHLNSYMLSWVEPLFLSIADYDTLETLPGGLRALSLALKLGLSGVLIYLFLRLRREVPAPAAVQHFMILIAIFISLIITPTAWAHYLSFLFVLPIMVFANAARFPPAAQVTAALAILFAFFQHPFLVRAFIRITDAAGEGDFLSVEKWWVLFSISAVKAVPMLLIYMLVTVWFASFVASYRVSAGMAPRKGNSSR